MPWRTSIGVALVLLGSGCLGVDRVEWTEPTRAGLPSLEVNETPTAVARIENGTRHATRIHFLGDDIHLDGNASRDADGRVVRWLWRIYAQASNERPLEREGSYLRFRPSEPGDYTAVLYASDRSGATSHAVLDFSVNRRATLDARLVALPSLPLPVPTGGPNLSLAAQPGILALSLNATFPPGEGSRVRLEIRDPDGVLLNRTLGAKAPLWSVALPTNSTHGHYTAAAFLDEGTTLPVRLEFVAWHGYVQ